MLGAPMDTHEVVEQVDRVWDLFVADEQITFKDTAEEACPKQQTIDLMSVYLDTIPAYEPSPLAAESRWEMPLVVPETGEDLGIPLLGFIDLVLDGPGGAAVIDFKTAATASTPVDISRELRLTSYAHLLRTAIGRTEGELQIRSLVKTKLNVISTDRDTPRILVAAAQQKRDAEQRSRSAGKCVEVAFGTYVECSIHDSRCGRRGRTARRAGHNGSRNGRQLGAGRRAICDVHGPPW